MPKLITSVMRAQLALLRPLITKMSIEDQRRGQDKLGELGVKVLQKKIICTDEPHERFGAAWIHPVKGDSGRAILYLHGGSYTAGSLPYARGFGSVLAAETKCSVFCIGYRLAPENPFPAALEDALEAYERVLADYPSEKIVVAGESAGGGLTLALALRLRQLGRPLPAGLVLISPWTDLTLSGSSFLTNRDLDVTLSEAALAQSAAFYARGDAQVPLVSPLFADLHGLPPSIVFAGSHELLLSDSQRLSQAMERDGVPCELTVSEGMWHAYVLYGVPESIEAIRNIRRFVRSL